MEPAEVSCKPDLSVASSSSKTYRYGIFNSICKVLFEQDAEQEYGLFSCFQFLRNSSSTHKMGSKASLLSDNSKPTKELESPKRGNAEVQVCAKCKDIYIREEVAVVDNPPICPRCYKKDENISRDRETSNDAGIFIGIDTEIESSTDNGIFKHPIQCTSCKKIYRTGLKEYMTDEEIFQYECLDCHLKNILISQQPKSAFSLAISIVEREVAKMKNGIWTSMCERPTTSRMHLKGEDRKCSAKVCLGLNRYRVSCNKCDKSFHSRCVSLPDYPFQHFRCNNCRERSYNLEENCSSSSIFSLEERARLRIPQGHPSYVPQPMVCYICKVRVHYTFDHLSIKPEPYQLRCMNCMPGKELMV